MSDLSSSNCKPKLLGFQKDKNFHRRMVLISHREMHKVNREQAKSIQESWFADY